MNTTRMTSNVIERPVRFIRSTFLAALFLGLSCTVLTAQLNFTAGSMIAEPGTTIEVPVTVSQFDSIAGFQLSMNWDADVLSFNAITQFDLDNIDNFDYNAGADDTLTMFWFAEDVETGYSVDDGHQIFTLEFTVVGAIGDSSWVSFIDEPLSPEAVDYKDDIVPIELTYGVVMIDEQSSTDVTLPTPIHMQIIPNPCREWCDLIVEVETPVTARLQVVSYAGHVVYEIEKELFSGQQEISLPAAEALQSGGYYVIVESLQGRYIKKLMVQH